MALDPKLIEGRNFGVVPLTGGLNLTDSKAIVQPGTLQDCLNYEVVDRGYARGQGLMLFNGSYGNAVEDMWYIADTTANGVSYTLGAPGSEDLGVVATWSGGSGKLVYWHVNYDADPAQEFAAIGITDVDGTPPIAAGLVITIGANTFTSPRAAQKLADATYPSTGLPVCGTQADYLTFVNDANTAITSQTKSNWSTGYKPNPPGTGAITGGFQFNDTVYVARDYFGLGFKDGVNEPNLDDSLLIDGNTVTLAGVVLEGGSWENGTAVGVFHLQPSDPVLTAADVAAMTTNTDQFTLVGLGTTMATYDGTRNKNKGQLWKSSVGGWLHVDLGWSVFFETGKNAPRSVFGPLFVTDLNPDDTFITDKIQATDYEAVGSYVEYGDSPLIAWTGLSNITADDGSVATAVLPANGGESYEIEAGFNASLGTVAMKITGVEVQVEARQTSGVNEVQLSKLRLVNNTTGAVFESDDKAYDTALSTSLTTYTFGGQFDEWGLEDISIDDLANYGVRLQFTNTDGSLSRAVAVDVVKVKIHFLATGQEVYLYDGTSNTGQGFIHSYEIYSGSWADDDATGHMTMTSSTLSSINNTAPGDVIWTGSGGTGTEIATITSKVKRNLLPSEAELDAEDSKWRTIEANFYPNDEGNAIYGCTGASPAFLFDTNEVFAYIYPPIDKNKNRPRHVAFNANHLVLGMSSGHVLISAIDQPNNFDPADNASTFSFRDPVTGLNPLTGNALGVMCKSSISALLGSQQPVSGANDPFRPQNITPLSGAIEYTVADVMGPMYADYNGVTTADASDKFGDFGAGRLTEKIESWTRDRVQNRPSTELRDRGPVFGVQVRSKNQYRVYFEDGYILTLYLGDPEQKAQCTIAHMDPTNFSTDYVPTWMDSTVLGTGRERILMGDKNGNVWVVDGANGIQDASGLTELDCWITTNPINTGAPQGAHKTFNLQILGDFYGSQDITTSIGYDYLDVSSTPRTKTVGDATAAPFFERRADYTDVYVDALTDGTSFKIQTTMDGSKPHTLHTLLHRFSRKGVGRNNTQVPR